MQRREKAHRVSLLALILLTTAPLPAVVAAGDEVLRTRAAMDAYRRDYLPTKGHKAFAQSVDGAWSWRGERVSRQFAEDDAVRACNAFLRKNDAPCVIVNVNGNWVSTPNTLQITGFRQGLIEFDKNNAPRIYKQGASFLYEANGSCVAAGKEKPCVWHGFEFAFEAPEENAELACISETNRPNTSVTPDQVLDPSTSVFHWKFTLQGRRGYYVRPQYTLGVVGQPFHKTTRCNYKGQEVLRFEFKFSPADDKSPRPTNT